jgi:Protein of unknown function (DUF2971)
VPKSRKRPKTRNSHSSTRDPLPLDRMFDQVKRPRPLGSAPRVLYHYTSMAGAKGILSIQQFWATAHYCTNDPAELSSADSIVVEVARELHHNASGTAARVLDLFASTYSRSHIAKSTTACLVCFSLSRDDEEQWRKYGDNGRGICLGVPVLDEPGPQDQPSALLKVDYSEESCRQTVRAEFAKICDSLSYVENLPKNVQSGFVQWGLSALNRQAAFVSMSAKHVGWAVEQEYRLVTLVSRNAKAQLKQRQSADGIKAVDYLPVMVRASGRRIALAEILIGPNRDPESTREELETLLAEKGYDSGSAEFPTVACSEVPSWPVVPDQTQAIRQEVAAGRQ